MSPGLVEWVIKARENKWLFLDAACCRTPLKALFLHNRHWELHHDVKKKKRGRPLHTVFAQRISINGSHEKVFKAEVAPTKTHTPISLRNTPAQTRTHTLLRP